MDTKLYREGMSKLAGAVTIVATDGDFGKGGITATAVCSVSDTPPTLLVCVNSENQVNTFIKGNKHFSINVLPKELQDLANRFAGMDQVSMADRFLKGNWSKQSTGSPLLEDSLVSFDCRLKEIQEMGTHTVMFGEVIDIQTTTQSQPLLYFQRNYATIS